MRARSGTVTALGAARPDAVELSVLVGGVACAALAYPSLVGAPAVGDVVGLNTTAVAQGLGTGGFMIVTHIEGRAPADPTGPGHLVKARYTPFQTTVLGVDEQASPHRAVMAACASLDGLPVVVADLHSALPAVLVGIRSAMPAARVAYVMTDGGALPLAFSRTVTELAHLLCGTVTAGQAYGGDLEAVTVHTALLACRAVLEADVVVLTQGPGNLGVGTPWGFSGVAAGDAVNAVAVLGGRPVASLRLSDADPRERHRGVSHHSLTAYGRVALAPADVVVPFPLPAQLAEQVAVDVKALALHRVVPVSVDGLYEELASSGLGLSTMGRRLEQDRWYFLAAAAAGRHAAALALGGVA